MVDRRFDAELLQLMAASGCDCLVVGLESMVTRVLQRVHKSADREENIRFLRQAHAAGIELAVNLIPDLYDEFGGFTIGIVFAHEFGHAIQTRLGVRCRCDRSEGHRGRSCGSREGRASPDARASWTYAFCSSTCLPPWYGADHIDATPHTC